MMEKQLTPWGFFECDFWTAIGSGVFQFSTPLHVGLFIQPDYNEKLPSSFRQESGLYQGSLAYSQAVVAYHHIFDTEYYVFDQEIVQQAHLLMSYGDVSTANSYVVRDKPTGCIKLALLVWLLFIRLIKMSSKVMDKKFAAQVPKPTN
jgi:hypothetical protein